MLPETYLTFYKGRMSLPASQWSPVTPLGKAAKLKMLASIGPDHKPQRSNQRLLIDFQLRVGGFMLIRKASKWFAHYGDWNLAGESIPLQALPKVSITMQAWAWYSWDVTMLELQPPKAFCSIRWEEIPSWQCFCPPKYLAIFAMFSYFGTAVLGIVVFWLLNKIRSLVRNVEIAKTAGLPYRISRKLFLSIHSTRS